MKKPKQQERFIRLTSAQLQQFQLVMASLDGKHGPQAQAVVRAQLARFGRKEHVKERLTRYGHA